MTLTRWNPSRDFLSLADEMNHLVQSVFGSPREASLLQGSWNPAVDVSQDKDAFYLNIELPGLTKDDVAVRYENGVLSISGEKKTEKEVEDKNYLRTERSYGKFERSFRITSRIVEDKIDAKFSNGILSVTLPKAEEVKPKEIAVKVN